MLTLCPVGMGVPAQEDQAVGLYEWIRKGDEVFHELQNLEARPRGGDSLTPFIFLLRFSSVLFCDRVSLYNPGCTRIYNPPAPASRVLG